MAHWTLTLKNNVTKQRFTKEESGRVTVREELHTEESPTSEEDTNEGLQKKGKVSERKAKETPVKEKKSPQKARIQVKQK